MRSVNIFNVPDSKYGIVIPYSYIQTFNIWLQ